MDFLDPGQMAGDAVIVKTVVDEWKERKKNWTLNFYGTKKI